MKRPLPSIFRQLMSTHEKHGPGKTSPSRRRLSTAVRSDPRSWILECWPLQNTAATKDGEKTRWQFDRKHDNAAEPRAAGRGANLRRPSGHEGLDALQVHLDGLRVSDLLGPTQFKDHLQRKGCHLRVSTTPICITGQAPDELFSQTRKNVSSAALLLCQAII